MSGCWHENVDGVWVKVVESILSLNRTEDVSLLLGRDKDLILYDALMRDKDLIS